MKIRDIKRLKFLIEKFSRCLYCGKDSSIATLIFKVNTKINDPLLFTQQEVIKVLQEWFSFLEKRIASTYSIQDLLNEFAFIIIRVHTIFKNLYQVLENQEEIVREIKRNVISYPTFKRLYTETINELEKFCIEKEIEPQFLPPLPEL